MDDAGCIALHLCFHAHSVVRSQMSPNYSSALLSHFTSEYINLVVCYSYYHFSEIFIDQGSIVFKLPGCFEMKKCPLLSFKYRWQSIILHCFQSRNKKALSLVYIFSFLLHCCLTNYFIFIFMYNHNLLDLHHFQFDAAVTCTWPDAFCHIHSSHSRCSILKMMRVAKRIHKYTSAAPSRTLYLKWTFTVKTISLDQ